MPFRDIFGQEHAIDLLNQAVQRGRMPHAWLFTGQANIGKYKTAVALAQKLNCRKCGEDACEKGEKKTLKNEISKKEKK